MWSRMREMPASGPDVGVQGPAAAGESAQAQSRAGLHCWVGTRKRVGAKVQALEGGGAGRKLLRGRGTAADRVPGVGNWDSGGLEA